MKKTVLSRLLSIVLAAVLLASTALIGTGYGETAATLDIPAEAAVLGSSFGFQVIDKEGNETWYLVNTDETTVGAALLAYGLIEGEESTWGLYVKTVQGITADYDKDGTYWAFYINGEYAATGVDATEVENGAVYTFKVQ